MSLSVTSIVTNLEDWSSKRWDVSALIVFGSQVDRVDGARKKDMYSDVDIQIVTWNPAVFANAEWTRIFGEKVSVYAKRGASGGVVKVTALWPCGAALDVIVVPSWKMCTAWLLVALGLHRRSSRLGTALSELATVMRGGFSLRKGRRIWGWFYRSVVEDVSGDRLSDVEICEIANAFVCDYVWVVQKVARGELIAAKRVLIRSMWESNIRLLYEWRLRRGEEAWRDGRRLEMIANSEELSLVALGPVGGVLIEDIEILKGAFMSLVFRLVGERWQWPCVEPLDLRF
jgi:hypothetical protein